MRLYVFKAEKATADADATEPTGMKAEKATADADATVATSDITAEKADATGATSATAACGGGLGSRLSLRANLLRWATLTPDLGIEWRASDHVSVLVNATWTTWSWNDKERRYALREIAPEVRYYFGGNTGGSLRGAYLGAQFKWGAFNYKFSETGKQGDIIGGGITGGYVLKLNNTLNLDFSLGLGYLHADYDEYVLTEGEHIRVRSGSGTKNWWGPTSLGVSLVWNLFK